LLAPDRSAEREAEVAERLDAIEFIPDLPK
jgi:hypothetical protein